MIDELFAKDIALIREARLYPARGLTVITGETGAGKTALLSALKLIAGERGDASMVREGADSLQVQARVYAAVPADGGFVDDDRGLLAADGVVVSRSLSADGRGRAHLDGSIAPVGKIAQVVGSTIDLCGQHEHQRLMKPSNHASMLDAWIGASAQDRLANYQQSYDQADAARAEVERIQAASQLSSEKVEQARYILRRINEVDPRPGEYEELCSIVPKMENAESLMQVAEGAGNALSGDNGALDLLGTAAHLLDSASGMDDELAAHAESLREASYIVEDVARDVSRYLDRIDYDTEELARMQERMAAMQGLMRTWGPGIEQVIAARDEAAATVSAVDGFEEQLAAARKQLERSLELLRAAGESLHDLRVEAAPRFSAQVSQQMARLELKGARLECDVELKSFDRWARSGPDKVEFAFRPGERLSSRPLAKIASGGEVSRVMLAIKVVLGDADYVDTLVFDEVDAGVGGTAARALADVLVDLSRTHQVIVVTHLAQIAVPAEAHYVVAKSSGEDPQTDLRLVTGEERVSEIARMLSGDCTEASLEHARQMLEESGSL